MSYGAYVQACIDARRRSVLGGPDWRHGAERFAADNLPEFDEERVIALLRAMRWPDRPVSVSEILRQLRATS